jgi:acetyl esterase/lipase
MAGMGVACTPAPVSQESPQIPRKWTDVAYASLSPAQQLDIYLPASGIGPFPVIISIHGGAFKMGDKADRQVQPMLQGLTRGYAVVSLNYRLSGEALYPAQIHDVKAAIRFLKAHATTYSLDTGRVAVWGGSAGGHLSALAATSGGVDTLEDFTLGNSGVSSRVQAVVDWFGPIDFSTMDSHFRTSGKGKPDHDAPDSPESLLLGRPVQAAPDLVRAASPATYISADDPPFLIQHGTEDPLVPTQQSQEFADALKGVLGDKVTLILLEGAGHGGPQFETPANLDLVFNFLDLHLKP